MKPKKNQRKRKDRERAEKESAGKNPILIIFILCLIYISLFSAIAFLKYRSFSFHDIDLALLNQTTWNTLQGRLVSQSFNQATILNGGHLFLIIFFLLPFYAIFTSPLTLLILQSLALALGAWPVYLLARDLIKPSFGLLFAFAYLIYPPLNWVNLFEIHFLAFATPLLLWMFYFYWKKRWWLYCAFMVLALSCRSDVALPVIGIGVFTLLNPKHSREGKRRDRFKWGIIPIIVALFWFIFCVTVIHPTFRPQLVPEFEPIKGDLKWLKFYNWMGGSSLSEIVKNIISHPQKFFQGIFSRPKRLYLLHLFVPVAFMPIFSSAGLVMVLISLVQGLFSGRFTHFSIRYQYSSIITPLIFISGIYGCRNLLSWKWLAGKQKFVFVIILLFSLVSARQLGPLFNLPEGIRLWRFTQEDGIKQKLVELIPPEVPVITTFEFAPKLSMRPELFHFYHIYSVSRHPNFRRNVPGAEKNSRYALIDFNDPLTFYDFYTPGGDRDIYRFLTKGKWQLLTTVNSIALFTKAEEANLGLVEKTGAPKIEHTLNLNSLPELKLLGYNIHKESLLGEKVINLEVYFQCLQQIRVDLLLSTQFISEQNPRFQFEQAFFASYRIYPTSRWRGREIVKQTCNILVPEDSPDGDYDLTLALLVQRGRGFEGKIIYRERKAFSLP